MIIVIFEGTEFVKKKILNIAFLAIVFGLTLWSVFRGENLNQVMSLLITANPVYVAVSVGCVVLFIACEAVIIFYLIHTLGSKIQFSHCCLYSFIGFFYSCITPSASGGQPMQIVTMRRDKIPVAVSTVVLAIVTIMYKTVLVLIGVAVLIWRPTRLMSYLEPVEALIYFGLFLNVICVAILLLLVFHPRAFKVIAEKMLSIMNRIRPFKNPEKQEERIERITSQYKGTAEYFKSHNHVIIKVFFMSVIQRLLLFAVTWFTYKALNLSGESFVIIIILQAMISVATDMLPLPGGMGICENMFLDIFLPIFGSTLVLPGMLLSRGISYYTQLIICGIMTIVAFLVIKEQKREKGE